MSERLDVHQYYLLIASFASLRSTCVRRRVGCVLTDKDNRVLSIGYNGVSRNQPHCIEHPCAGAGFVSGEGLNHCEAIHAEVSAIGVCRDIQSIYNVYTTVSPCINCTKVLLSTPCQNVYFIREYPHPDAISLWLKAGRTWQKTPIDYDRLEELDLPELNIIGINEPLD